LPSLSYSDLQEKKIIPSGLFQSKKVVASSFPRWGCNKPCQFGIFAEFMLRVFMTMPDKPASVDELHLLRDKCLMASFGEVPKDVDKSDTLLWKFYHFSREVREFSQAGQPEPLFFFDAEFEKKDVQGHPDILTPNTILDVKTTRSFTGSMLYTTILQLLSYYALSNRTRPFIGVVLPMTSDILVEYVGNWKPDAYLECLQEVAVTYLEVSDMRMTTVGSHISKHKNGVLASLREVYEPSKTAPKGFIPRDFEIPSQIFLSSPQGGNKVYLDEKEIEETREYIQSRGIRLYVHLPYYINLCNPITKKGDSIEVVTNELAIAGAIGCYGAVIHIGAALELSVADATEAMRTNIRRILPYATERCPLLLETCVGEGSEILFKPEDLSKFYMSFTREERQVFKLCLDSCHCFAAGYNPSVFLHHLIAECGGPSTIRLIHFNDSVEPCGSHKDRHALVGRGCIGELEMKKLYHIADLSKIDMVIE
jgi:deoxyribonuclease IV